MTVVPLKPLSLLFPFKIKMYFLVAEIDNVFINKTKLNVKIYNEM